MGNLNEIIQSMGGLVLIGTIIVLGSGGTLYGLYSAKKILSEEGYDKTVFNLTNTPESGYNQGTTTGGTRRKKNKSRKK